jgi:leucyl-tRNA synthetase
MKDSSYQFKEIEKKWREKWEEWGHNRISDNDPRPKYYCLDMFPYPSASGLHVGHWRGYVISDMWSRYMLLRGYNVLHPMGWDAFGLPAENDAIKKNVHPKINTERNISNYRRQLKEISAVYDWSREINTSDPDYYRWTQWIFVRMYKKGLAYRTSMPINWCPDCKTGLANEEVVDGKCDRCGTVVVKKDMVQWMLRITDYADRLLAGLKDLDWPERVKTMQTNWIGRSEGAEVVFTVKKNGGEWQIPVFTTRPDTLFGATYLVLAPEHKLTQELCSPDHCGSLRDYIDKTRKMTEVERTNVQRDKTGIALGIETVNPVNGENIPVWVADYVLTSYGTGAIMAVPAHDERDFEFAQQFELPIVEVISSKEATRDENNNLISAYTGEGEMINSGPYNGMDSVAGRKEIVEWLSERELGKPRVNYRLRDWVFSRQRYWGEPIPIIYCEKCGEVPVPEEDLPVELPDVESYKPTGTGESPLAAIEEWVNTECPECGKGAKRETDTMPQWAGSCWYFLRYPSPHYTKGPFDPEKVGEWLPVDSYFGGVEHAILHLLYARFYSMFLYDIGQIDFEEPFKKLFNQGMIYYNAFRCTNHGFIKIKVGTIDDGKCPECGEDLEKEFYKMSKSVGNVVSPDTLVEMYSTDTLRMYELFTGPPDQDSEWSERGIEGVYRFLKRLWVWYQSACEEIPDSTHQKINKEYHLLVKDITQRIEEFRLNTTISRFMEFLNFLMAEENKNLPVARDVLEGLATLLSPIAPHLAEEVWEKLGHNESIFKSEWPEFSEELAQRERITIAVQVNGKLRDTLEMDKSAGEDVIKDAATKSPRVSRHIEGKDIKRVIFVPGKILNFIVA